MCNNPATPPEQPNTPELQSQHSFPPPRHFNTQTKIQLFSTHAPLQSLHRARSRLEPKLLTKSSHWDLWFFKTQFHYFANTSLFITPPFERVHKHKCYVLFQPIPIPHHIISSQSLFFSLLARNLINALWKITHNCKNYTLPLGQTQVSFFIFTEIFYGSACW